MSLATEPEKLERPEMVALFAQEIANRVTAFLMRGTGEDTVLDTTQTLAEFGWGLISRD